MRDLKAEVVKFMELSEQRIGPLSDRQKAELLYDNFIQIASVEDGLDFLKRMNAEET